MVTLLEFLGELVTSAIRLVVIIVVDVVLRDPLSFVAGLLGGLLIGLSVLFVGYLVLGMVVDLLGASMWSPGRGRERRA
jgi:hypothetical protein